MEHLIGLFLPLAAAGFAIIVGLDRDRAFYPTVLIWIASNYVLFAAMGASGRTLILEIIVAGEWVGSNREQAACTSPRDFARCPRVAVLFWLPLPSRLTCAPLPVCSSCSSKPTRSLRQLQKHSLWTRPEVSANPRDGFVTRRLR